MKNKTRGKFFNFVRYSSSSIVFPLLILLLLFQDNLKAQEKSNLITSGVKLKPILIGKEPENREQQFQFKGKKFDGYLNLVTDTPYQIWGEMGTYIHLAVYDPNFKPADEATVYMDGKAFGKTDENGTFVFSQVPNPDMSYDNQHNLEVVYTKNGKTYYGTTFFNAYPRTQSFESSSIFIYTDRGVYNPGQTIHLRAIAWTLKDDFSPMVGKEIEILLKNQNGKVIAGGGIETDKWGIAWMDIPLPPNAPSGNYQLEANYERESATASIRIERFTPPIIEIKHTLPRFVIKGASNLPFDVTLGYFGGGVFKNGKVEVELKAKGKIIWQEKREVKGAGPHKFTMERDVIAKIENSVSENEYVEVKISVTDDLGRKDEVKRQMRYSSNPYNVIVEMDKDQYTTGETAHVIIRAADLEQVPARDKEITLKIEGKIYKAKTDSDGIARIEVKVPDRNLWGDVYIEGVDRIVANAYINWQPLRPMSSHIPQGYVKEREKTDIVIDFPTDFIPYEKVVHVDITDSSGAIIGSELIPVKKEGGKYIAKGSFKAPAWGSMLLTLFCIGRKGNEPVGLLTDGQNLPVIANREIKIDMNVNPQKAKPGDKVKIIANIQNAEGEKVTGSVGASIVDQAVLSLLDPLEKTPMDKFYRPELKVLSSTGSKILTWPVVARNWGSPQYDIALPPFGFRKGGATNPVFKHDEYTYEEGIGSEDISEVKKSYKKAVKSKGGGGMDLVGELGGLGSAYEIPAPSMKAEVSVPAEMASASLQGTSEQEEYPKESRSAEITIRTNFAETSLWAPAIEVKDGHLEFYSELPDSITTQTVTMVASDDKGGVGVSKKQIDVNQDIYVRGALPAVLTIGDSVEVYAFVSNFTKKEISAKVSLKSDMFEVIGSKEKEIKVPAEGASAVSFIVKSVKAGNGSYEVKAVGSSFIDVEKREIFVRPPGIPDIIEAKGTISRGKPFKANIRVSGKDQYLTAFVNVSFPTIIPVLQGLEKILDEPGGAIDFISSKALTTAMVYRYLVEKGASEDAILKLKPVLQNLMSSLLITQNTDGGWGWHFMLRNVSTEGKEDLILRNSNPYMTAQSLEGLIALKRAGLPVPWDAINSAAGFLLATVNSNGLWSVSDIAFWEGNTLQVQEGISAEIFRVLTDACETFPELKNSYEGTLDKIFENYRNLISQEDKKDPMFLANAAMGIYTWAKIQGKLEDVKRILKNTAQKLILLRKEAYWEPSWFNAFGGTIEATVAAMMFMSKFDREGYEAELRNSVRYILSTQESFGAWHNARGTAAAIRGLLLLPPAETEVPSTVVLSIDGRIVKKVEINPSDPYLSAISLRELEITDFLKKGDNKIEINYDGNLKAPVTLHLEKWTAQKSFSAVARDGAPQVRIKREYGVSSIQEGNFAQVNLLLDIKDSKGPIIIQEPLPSNAELDFGSLDELADSGKVSGYEIIEDTLIFYVTPSGKEEPIKISYRLEGTRRGISIQPGSIVSSIAYPENCITGLPTILTVK